MPTSVTLDGVLFQDTDFANYGWLTNITVNGNTYIRLLGLFAAAMADLGRSMVGAATSTHNLSTMTVSSSVTVTLSANVPYRNGAYVQVAQSGGAGTNYFNLQLTADCTGTSMTGTVLAVSGSGSISSWSTQLIGATGAAGAGALAAGGIKTAAFNMVTNTAYVVDMTAASGGNANVTGTLTGSFAAEDRIEVTVINDDGVHTFTLNGVTNNIATNGSVQNGTIDSSGILTGVYKNAGYGFRTGWATGS